MTILYIGGWQSEFPVRDPDGVRVLWWNGWDAIGEFWILSVRTRERKARNDVTLDLVSPSSLATYLAIWLPTFPSPIHYYSTNVGVCITFLKFRQVRRSDALMR